MTTQNKSAKIYWREPTFCFEDRQKGHLEVHTRLVVPLTGIRSLDLEELDPVEQSQISKFLGRKRYAPMDSESSLEDGEILDVLDDLEDGELAVSEFKRMKLANRLEDVEESFRETMREMSMSLEEGELLSQTAVTVTITPTKSRKSISVKVITGETTFKSKTRVNRQRTSQGSNSQHVVATKASQPPENLKDKGPSGSQESNSQPQTLQDVTTQESQPPENLNLNQNTQTIHTKVTQGPTQVSNSQLPENLNRKNPQIVVTQATLGSNDSQVSKSQPPKKVHQKILPVVRKQATQRSQPPENLSQETPQSTQTTQGSAQTPENLNQNPIQVILTQATQGTQLQKVSQGSTDSHVSSSQPPEILDQRVLQIILTQATHGSTVSQGSTDDQPEVSPDLFASPVTSPQQPESTSQPQPSVSQKSSEEKCLQPPPLKKIRLVSDVQHEAPETETLNQKVNALPQHEIATQSQEEPPTLPRFISEPFKLSQTCGIPLRISDIAHIELRKRGFKIFGCPSSYLSICGHVTQGRTINEDTHCRNYTIHDGTGKISVRYMHQRPSAPLRQKRLDFVQQSVKVLEKVNSPDAALLEECGKVLKRNNDRALAYATLGETAFMVGRPVKRKDGSMFIDAKYLEVDSSKDRCAQLNFLKHLMHCYENIFKKC